MNKKEIKSKYYNCQTKKEKIESIGSLCFILWNTFKELENRLRELNEMEMEEENINLVKQFNNIINQLNLCFQSFDFILNQMKNNIEEEGDKLWTLLQK